MWRDIALQNRAAMLGGNRPLRRAPRGVPRVGRARRRTGPAAAHGGGAREPPGARRRRPPQPLERIAWSPSPSCRGSPAQAAGCACRAPRASPTARCCWPRSRAATRTLDGTARIRRHARDAQCARRARREDRFARHCAARARFTAWAPRAAFRRSAPSSSWATPAPPRARSRACWRSPTATIASRACRACTSARSAISSRRSAPWARASNTSASPAFRRSRSRRATGCRSAQIHIRGDVSSQFLSGVLMALPWAGESAHVQIEGELDLQALRGAHVGLMERFGVRVEHDEMRAFSIPAACRLRLARNARRRGRRFVGLVLPRGGRAGRRAGARRGRGSQTARRATSASPTCSTAMGAQVEMGNDWIEARGRAPAQALRPRHEPHSRRRDDRRGAGAVRRAARARCATSRSWRVKETDRIAAMATELRKFGARRWRKARTSCRSSRPRFLERATRRRVAIDTYDDHRMAMCFSLAAFGPRAGAHQRSRLRRQDVSRLTSRAFARWSPAMAPAVPVIAIDGPSASGKGTVAARVAAGARLPLPRQRRALSAGGARRDARRRGPRRRGRRSRGVAARACTSSSRGGATLAGRRDVTEALRSRGGRHGRLAGRGACRPVRQALLARQRGFRAAPGLVADGRDMGSVVFPDAPLKVFLTAGVETRAERRYKQLMEKGMYAKMPDVVEELATSRRERQLPSRGAAKALSRRNFSRYHGPFRRRGGAADSRLVAGKIARVSLLVQTRSKRPRVSGG